MDLGALLQVHFPWKVWFKTVNKKEKERKIQKSHTKTNPESAGSSKTVSALQSMCPLTQASKSMYCIIKKVAI